jgi:hypothetical protein
VSWLRHYATSRKDAGSIFDEVIQFFNWPNSSSCTKALLFTQPLVQLTGILLAGGGGGKGWPARKADNRTALSEPTVYQV